MVKLKARLRKMASLVIPGSVVADIGTDHGYLPFYLICQGISPKVFATEQSLLGLKEVSKLKEDHGLGAELQLRTGDGFSALYDDDCPDIAVISGMGGRTIAEIIQKGIDKASAMDYLILQPMRDIHLLRSSLKKIGFCIISEHLALENSFFFEIIKVEKGEAGKKRETPFPNEVSASLIESGDPLLRPYLENKLERSRQLVMSLSKTKQEKAQEKKNYYKELINYLEEMLLTVSKCSGDYEDNR